MKAELAKGGTLEYLMDMLRPGICRRENSLPDCLTPGLEIPWPRSDHPHLQGSPFAVSLLVPLWPLVAYLEVRSRRSDEHDGRFTGQC